jgi:nucleotide-binding universal stress UspA family protein
MLALDNSRYADAIVNWMKTFPHPVNTRLTLVYVVEPLDIPEEIAVQPVLRREQRAAADELLSGFERTLQKHYSDIKLRILEGFPIYEILRVIREENPDLIVSGTRGLRAGKGLALGSVSQRLLTYAPCSVMLVPAKVRSTRRLRVALATDGSESAREAARLVTLLPDIKEVTVFSVARPVEARDISRYSTMTKRGLSSLRTELGRARRDAANRSIEETLTVLRPAGLRTKTRVVIGHPAEAISGYAKKERCDLLVVGSRGLTGVMAMAMGSVSLTVAQSAPCPVIVVKRLV